MGIATFLQTGVEGIATKYVTSASAALSAEIVPLAVTGITIYLILMGWAIARGEVHSPMSTLVWRCARISLIAGIALSVGIYQHIVVDGVNGIEGVFTNALGGAQNIGALIDQDIVPFETLTGELYAKANAGTFPDFRLLTCAVMCTFGQVAITLLSLVPLLAAKMGLSLLLAVGPVFLMLALWPATVRHCEAWITATLSMVMTTVVLAAVVGFLPTFIQAYAAQVLGNLGKTNILQDVVSLTIVILVLGWLAWKSKEFAAQMIGGTTLGNPLGGVVQGLLLRLGLGGGAGTGAQGGSIRQRRLQQQNTIRQLNKSPE